MFVLKWKTLWVVENFLLENLVDSKNMCSFAAVINFIGSIRQWTSTKQL